MQFTIVRSPAEHDLDHFKNLKRSRSHSNFIAEGEKVVVRLLESSLPIGSIYLTEEHFESKRALLEAHEQDSEIKVFIAKKGEMEEIVGFPLHQGILAACKVPPEPTLEELIQKTASPRLFIILDEIADSENMGSIYRTSLAMGATGVIVDPKSVHPWMRRSVRVSMGAMFSLPTISVSDLPSAITTLNNHNIPTYATTLSETAKPIWDNTLDGDIALVFGSEGYGVSKDVIRACKGELLIPMSQSVDSLNVSIAQGVFLYEILRQRAKK